MDDEEIHWQCPHCGVINWHAVCHNGCGRPRPSLDGWLFDPEQFWYHPDHPPASLELRDWRRAHPWEFDPPGMT